MYLESKNKSFSPSKAKQNYLQMIWFLETRWNSYAAENLNFFTKSEPTFSKISKAL